MTLGRALQHDSPDVRAHRTGPRTAMKTLGSRWKINELSSFARRRGEAALEERRGPACRVRASVDWKSDTARADAPARRAVRPTGRSRARAQRHQSPGSPRSGGTAGSRILTSGTTRLRSTCWALLAKSSLSFANADARNRQRSGCQIAAGSFGTRQRCARRSRRLGESPVHLIGWRDMIGMRNIIAHEYGRVDPDELWKTADRDMPLLVSNLKRS